MKANELKRKRNDDRKVEENLLNNNKFSPLADSNNNENADQAGGGGAAAVPAPNKPSAERRQPPLVVTNLGFYRLLDVMALCEVKPEYNLTRRGIKVCCSSEEDFNTLKALFQKHQVQFYTHGRRCDRPHRVVLRGLPDVIVEDLKIRLKNDHNLEVLDVKAIKRKTESPSDDTPYIVSFPKGHTNLKKLSSVKKVVSVIVRWEAYRNKQPYVTQCTNCLRLGHGARNCFRRGRCNKCGKSHKTEECNAEETQAKRCANCSGEHEALDRSCPKREEFIRARQQAAKPKRPTEKATKANPTVPAFTLGDFPPLPDATPGKEGKSPRNGGVGGGGTGTRAGGTTQEEGAAGSSQGHAGPRAGDSPKAEGQEELYSPAELWKIFVEFSAKLKNSKTRSDQVAVLGYMICKYGSK